MWRHSLVADGEHLPSSPETTVLFGDLEADVSIVFYVLGEILRVVNILTQVCLQFFRELL